ncbi:MAG: SCO family protein [Phyllobacteriaceae bacterium]|nr:SCO family protein [Phyllobacteriaceae bacterium]
MLRKVMLALVLVIAGALGYLALDWLKPGSGEKPYGGDFALVDQNGQPITQEALRGHPTMVFFGFTHCPEICPTTLFEMSQWFEALGDEGKELRAYFFTVDPERDTPQLLGGYISGVSDRVIGITGDPEKVWANAKAFGIYWKKVPTSGDDYTMDHTASVILLKNDGSFFGTIAFGEAKDSAVAKLRRLIAG